MEDEEYTFEVVGKKFVQSVAILALFFVNGYVIALFTSQETTSVSITTCLTRFLLSNATKDQTPPPFGNDDFSDIGSDEEEEAYHLQDVSSDVEIDPAELGSDSEFVAFHVFF